MYSTPDTPATPPTSVVVRMLSGPIRAYRRFLSPLAGQRCRFHPSCSSYALEALERHGALRGSWLALRRLSRCQPFHPGGIDPVPSAEPAALR